MSGHIFFNDKWFGFDDGIYAGCRLLEILSGYDLTPSDFEWSPYIFYHS